MSELYIDKQAVARNFSGAATQYDYWATAQAQIAEGLARRLAVMATPRCIVDLGCGTGLLSGFLLTYFPEAALTGLDIADGMIEICRRRWATCHRTRFVVGDAEDPAQKVANIDLITSSCALQWFARPAATLAMWAESLTAGGLLACAVLLKGSFDEMFSIYRRALATDMRGVTLWDESTASGIAVQSGLHVCRRDEETFTTLYESPSIALRSFRKTGATFHGHQGYEPLGLGQTRRLLSAYKRYADALGRVPVTYRVQYVIAERST